MTETKLNPDRLRHNIWQLVLDWILLHNQLPTPTKSQEGRRTTNREYGHPAEWASDKAAQIAHTLTSWHDLLAEHRGETQPAQNQSEQAKIIAAWKYLQCRTEELCDLIEPEALHEIPNLHHSIRRTLGYTNPPQALPMPCPHPGCELRTLQRHIRVGADYIQCGNCGWTADETHYPLLIRITLDTLLRTA